MFQRAINKKKTTLLHFCVSDIGSACCNPRFWGDRIRVAKRGIAPAESPLFLAPRGRGRGQLSKEHRGITGTGNRYAIGDFWGIFPEGLAKTGKGTGTHFA